MGWRNDWVPAGGVLAIHMHKVSNIYSHVHLLVGSIVSNHDIMCDSF